MGKSSKTYKREVAVGMLLYLGGISIWGVFEPRAWEIAQFQTIHVITFALAAFGLDAWAKQIKPMPGADDQNRAG